MKTKTIKLNISHLIMGAIILLLLIFLFFRPSIVDTSKYDIQKQEIKKLKNNIDSLKNEQNILNVTLKKQENFIDSINTEIKLTEQELQQTRTYYGNKIKDLTSASNSELEQFFSDRYR